MLHCLLVIYMEMEDGLTSFVHIESIKQFLLMGVKQLPHQVVMLRCLVTSLKEQERSTLMNLKSK
jgi:hypothetical protein